jgi:hypothetical protein
LSNAGQRFRNDRVGDLSADQKNPLQVLYAAAANCLLPYNRPVMLVRSRKRLHGLAGDGRLGSDHSLIPHLELCEAAGNHYTMYTEPNVEGLAELRNSWLKKAAKHLERNIRAA